MGVLLTATFKCTNADNTPPDAAAERAWSIVKVFIRTPFIKTTWFIIERVIMDDNHGFGLT
jgi:hypothetical protein